MAVIAWVRERGLLLQERLQLVRTAHLQPRGDGQLHRGTTGDELQGAGRAVVVVDGTARPLRSHGTKRLAVQAHQRLGDDTLVLPRAALHAHHGGDGDAATLPLLHGRQQVVHRHHQACAVVLQQRRRRGAHGVAVVVVEVGRQAGTPVVAEEVELRHEVAVVGALLRTPCQFQLHHACQQLLRLDLRHGHVAVGISIQQQLQLHGLGQGLKHGGVVGAEVLVER